MKLGILVASEKSLVGWSEVRGRQIGRAHV